VRILRQVPVPTGDIVVVQGERGQLEFVCLGDYGKDVNLKCNAMGLTREPDPVRHTKLLPLEDKWVITVSTQYGCSMGCTFCDVPKVGPGFNVSEKDIFDQIQTGIDMHPEVEECKRLNIHFARMGEPTWNPNVLEVTRDIYPILDEIRFPVIHPVVSTMMPRNNKWLLTFLRDWMYLKNDLYEGEAGLQLSINSTNLFESREMFNDNALTIKEIWEVMRKLPPPRGRKITLNFAVAGYEIDPDKLHGYFSPDKYIIKLTPMHKTTTALANDIRTSGDYTTYEPYKHYEEALIKAGYDVLVFIASREEDEGLITCGNAILSGSTPFGAGVV